MEEEGTKCDDLAIEKVAGFEALREGPLTLDDAVVRAADRAARIWEASEAGPIVLGSEGHKRAFCRMLIDTHNPYRPSIVDWPILDPEARDRLVSLPIWDIAMQTEGNASLRVLSYAETIKDPLLREAVEINGFEETRHKQVLSNLVQAYGIPLAPEPEYLRPRHPEWAFLLAGFCECVDTFFAFGLFALAKRSDFFRPPSSTPSSLWCRRRAGIFSFSSIGWPGTGATCRRGGALSSWPKSFRCGLFSSGRGSASCTVSMVAGAGQRPGTTTSSSPAARRSAASICRPQH